MARKNRRRRRNLRFKIYELKKFIDTTMGKHETKNCCHDALFHVLEEMCNLFDIPRIGEFLVGGDYSDIRISKEKDIEDIKEKSLDERKALVRKMLGIKIK